MRTNTKFVERRYRFQIGCDDVGIGKISAVFKAGLVVSAKGAGAAQNETSLRPSAPSQHLFAPASASTIQRFNDSTL